jgi:methyl-accepting chemotaxis protein
LINLKCKHLGNDGFILLTNHKLGNRIAGETMGTDVNVKSIAVQSILLIFFVAFTPVILVSLLGNVGMTTLGIGLIASIVMAYLGYRIINGVITPIGRLVGVTDRLAAGDLDADLGTGAKSGELGQVNLSLAKIADDLKAQVAMLRVD